MPDYSRVDAAILSAILGGKHHFFEIHSQLAKADLPEITYDKGVRVVDRRLQALRTKNKIEYRGQQSKTGGWYLTEGTY